MNPEVVFETVFIEKNKKTFIFLALPAQLTGLADDEFRSNSNVLRGADDSVKAGEKSVITGLQ